MPTIIGRSLLSFVPESLNYFWSVQSVIDHFEEESKIRIIERCKLIKEQLMMNTWHPSRVEKKLLAGIDIEDM